MLSASRTRRFIEENVLFTVLVLASAVLIIIGGYVLFSQAQLSNPSVALQKNWKAWFIIGCYAGLVSCNFHWSPLYRWLTDNQFVISLLIIGRRLRILALKLKRIPQKDENVPNVSYVNALRINISNIPQKIYTFVQEEYWRTAAIAYVSQPKGSSQKGWGTPSADVSSLFNTS